MIMNMNLLVVTGTLERSQPVLQAAVEAGYRIVNIVEPGDAVTLPASEVRVDAILFISEQIEQAHIEVMRSVSEQNPHPMLVFTSDNRKESIDACVGAGVAGYVVDCVDMKRLSSLVQVACSRFEQYRDLLLQLDSARSALAERKLIERAKGIIMRQRSIDEESAYKAMRKLAMDHNKKIAEVAGQIVTAAEILL
jgi:response regulator NasT